MRLLVVVEVLYHLGNGSAHAVRETFPGRSGIEIDDAGGLVLLDGDGTVGDEFPAADWRSVTVSQGDEP